MKKVQNNDTNKSPRAQFVGGRSPLNIEVTGSLDDFSLSAEDKKVITEAGLAESLLDQVFEATEVPVRIKHRLPGGDTEDGVQMRSVVVEKILDGKLLQLTVAVQKGQDLPEIGSTAVARYYPKPGLYVSPGSQTRSETIVACITPGYSSIKRTESVSVAEMQKRLLDEQTAMLSRRASGALAATTEA